MNKLSSKHPPTKDFQTCCICGTHYDDICEVNLWQEHDLDAGRDVPTSTYVVICKKKACEEVLDAHELLYVDLPWSAGGPGKFMLTCGPCKFREGFNCTHKLLKTNGGPGLEMSLGNSFLNSMIVCSSEHGCLTIPRPIVFCTGFQR